MPAREAYLLGGKGILLWVDPRQEWPRRIALPRGVDGQVRALAVLPGAPLHVAVGVGPRVVLAELRPDGRSLRTLRTIRLERGVLAVRFSLDRRHLLVTGETAGRATWIVAHELESGATHRRTQVSRLHRLLPIPQGRFLLGSRNGRIVEFRIEPLRAVGEMQDRQITIPVAHSGSVEGLCLARDRRRLFSVARSGRLNLFELKVWDAAERRLLRTEKLPHSPESLALSPDGRALLIGTSAGRAILRPVPPN